VTVGVTDNVVLSFINIDMETGDKFVLLFTVNIVGTGFEPLINLHSQFHQHLSSRNGVQNEGCRFENI